MIELILAGLLGVVGLVSALRSLSRTPGEDEGGRERLLIAVHDAAKALFWFSLAAFFWAYGIADEPQGVRWLALIPIAMAGIRLLAATALARS